MLAKSIVLVAEMFFVFRYEDNRFPNIITAYPILAYPIQHTQWSYVLKLTLIA